MKIDRKLNLVIPVVPDDGMTYHVHVQPLAREVFEQNFTLIAHVFNEILATGMTGPRLATLTLRKTAADLGQEDAAERLIIEMRRLANVLVPTPTGYDVLPWQQAVDRKLFDDEDTREVDNVLCFFMVAWHMHAKKELEMAMRMLQLIGVEQTTSLTPTAYGASLTTSTAGETLDQATPARRSSIPH